jgi:hypothetical protein
LKELNIQVRKDTASQIAKLVVSITLEMMQKEIELMKYVQKVVANATRRKIG